MYNLNTWPLHSHQVIKYVSEHFIDIIFQRYINNSRLDDLLLMGQSLANKRYSPLCHDFHMTNMCNSRIWHRVNFQVSIHFFFSKI